MATQAQDPGSAKAGRRELGDLGAGRPNLGRVMDVAVYRLMQYTLREVLTRRFGAEEAAGLFVEAGFLAGSDFCRDVLDCRLDFNAFIADLQARMKNMSIGILRVERADLAGMEFLLTVAEDLDCSGLPVTGRAVCSFDEGLLAGIFTVYTGRPFEAREVDCWATGGRVCRFSVRPATPVVAT